MTSKLLIIAGLGIGYYIFVKKNKYKSGAMLGTGRDSHKSGGSPIPKEKRYKVIPKKTLSISTVINQPIITPIEIESVSIVELEEIKRQVRIDTVAAINRDRAIERARQAEITRVAAIKSTGIIPYSVSNPAPTIETVSRVATAEEFKEKLNNWYVAVKKDYLAGRFSFNEAKRRLGVSLDKAKEILG